MEPQKNFQNSKEMSKDLVNYRRNLRESKRDELSQNFRGFPFKSKLYRLNKAQLFTLCRMLNTIGLKQNLPTNNNSITVAELKNRIQNCSLLNGFEIHNKTVNQILSKAINNYVKTQKPKYSGQYKNQFKNVVDELFMMHGDDEKQMRKSHKQKHSNKIKASQLKNLFDEEAAQLREEAEQYSKLASFLDNEFGDKYVSAADLEDLFDETHYKPSKQKYEPDYDVQDFFESNEYSDESNDLVDSIIEASVENIEAIFFRQPQRPELFVECYNKAIHPFENNDYRIQNNVLNIEEAPRNKGEIADDPLYDEITDDKNNDNQHIIETEYYKVKSLEHLKEIVKTFIDDSSLPVKINFAPYLIIEEEADDDVHYTAINFDYNANISLTRDLLVTDYTSIHTVYNRIMESMYECSNTDVRRDHNYPGNGICCYAISLIRYKLVATGAEDKYNEK